VTVTQDCPEVKTGCIILITKAAYGSVTCKTDDSSETVHFPVFPLGKS